VRIVLVNERSGSIASGNRRRLYPSAGRIQLSGIAATSSGSGWRLMTVGVRIVVGCTNEGRRTLPAPAKPSEKSHAQGLDELVQDQSLHNR